MPVVRAEDLEVVVARIFAARGVPETEAAWIATLLVRANLRGHDSHGVIRVPQYVAAMMSSSLISVFGKTRATSSGLMNSTGISKRRWIS